jgi:ribosomal protein S27AE
MSFSICPRIDTIIRRINLEKIMASLTTLCPKCGYSIPPNETQRVSFTEMRCPKCNAVFVPGEKT